MAQYLLVIGDREALGWVLTEQRMAFPDVTRAEVRALAPGDTLYLYTTRGCFRHPRRDRGRIIAAGTATSAVVRLDEAVEFAGRKFPMGCAVEFTSATAWLDGVELGQLTDELPLFRGAGQYWRVRLRRTLVPLTRQDTTILNRHLTRHAQYPLDGVLDNYAHWWRSAQAKRAHTP